MLNPFRLSDEQVIRRVRAGRRDDFGVLVRRYMSAIHAFACAHVGNRADADDIVQETFLRAYESLDSLRDASRVGPWLFAIARNACRNHVRTQIRRETREQAVMPMETSAPSDVARREAREVLREKVAQLEEDAREVLLLHYFADKRVAEIAGLLDISPDAAKKRLQRAREALGELVARELVPAYQSDRPDSERTKAVMGLIAASPAPWAATATGTATVAAVSAAKVAAVGIAVIAAVGGGYVAVQTARGTGADVGDTPAAASTAVSSPSPAEAAVAPPPAAAPVTPAKAPDAIPFAPDGSGATVRAVLRTDAGDVPQGATVRLVKRVPEQGRPFSAVAEADSKGRAYFTGVPMDFYYLRATAPGYFGAAEFTLEEEPFREVPLTLRKAGPLRGVVRDKDGRPIAGAVLTTSYYKPTPQSGFTPTHGADQQAAVSEANGVFAFENVWTGYWTLQAEAAGFARQFTDYFKVGTTDTAIVLGRMGSLSGRVVEAATGQPVPGIAVVVSGAEPVIAEPDGSFRVRPKNLGQLEIEIKDDRFVLESPRMQATIHEGAETSGVEVRVIPAAAISGRIYRADGGQDPLHEVHIQLQASHETLPESHWITPDAEGRYRIAGLRPGTYTLTHVSFAGNLHPPADVLARSLELQSGQEIADVDFALQEGQEQAGIRITGRVVDASGRPVSKATVHGWLSAGGRGSGHGGGTGADGSFSLAFDEPGSLTLEAGKGDDVSDTAGPFDLTQAGLSGIALHLRPGGVVAGRVLEPSGDPVSKARVELLREGSFGGANVETELDGAFEFRGLAPGSYTVKSEAAGSATVAVTRGSRQEITLKSGGDETAIAGRVVDEHGKPVAEASIHVDPDSGPGSFLATDLEGRFAIPGLSSGVYDLTVSSDRHVTATRFGVPSGTKDLELVLQPRGAVEGRVTLAGAAGPIEGAEVQIGPADAGPESLASLSPGMYRATRPDGSFRIENVEPGRRSVAARAPGYAPQMVPVEVTAGQTVEGIVLTLRPGAAIEGRVVNAAGEPVAEASVFFNRLPFIPPYPRPAASLDGVALSASDGRFRIDSVPSGVTRLAVYHPDYAPCLVAAAPGTPVNVTLTAGATVSGVVRMDGRAVSGAPLSLRISGGNLTRHAQTDAQGAFAFALLPPGEAHLTLSHHFPGTAGAPEAVHREVSVPDGGALTVDFDIAAGNGAVEGLVTLPPGDIQGVVTCIGQTASGTAAWSSGVAPDGTYRIDGLPAGNATVAVLCNRENDRRGKSAEVLVEAGGVARCDFDLTAPGAAITGRHTPAPGDRGMVFVMAGRHTVEELQGGGDPFLPLRHVASVRVREDGAFRVEGLDPGTYTVVTGANDATVVEVPAGGEVEAQF